MAMHHNTHSTRLKVRYMLKAFSLFSMIVFTLLFIVFTWRRFSSESANKGATMTQEKFQNSLGTRFVWIPAGDFIMGSEKTPVSPAHKVVLDGFWMAVYETTNLEFEHFKIRPRPVESLGDNQPVTRVSWKEAGAFCRWLSKKEGKMYRLPTEAEWEYAARGGLKGKDWPWGDEGPDGRATFSHIPMTPVGSYAPNGFGLYDMAGNAREWVSDWYDSYYYNKSPKKNPQGPKKGDFKVTRGGSFLDWSGYVWLRLPWSTDVVGNVSKPNILNEADGNGFRVVVEKFPSIK